MTEPTTPRYRYWGAHKPIADQLRVEMAASADQPAQMKVYGPIDDWGQPFGVSADEFGQALAQLGDVKAIDVHIHSPGGIAFEGVAIMNQLRQHPAKINAVVDGLCASAASVIAMGADTVTMVPGAQMMIHDASGLCIGNATDMETMRTRLDSLSQNIADQYAAKAGGDPADWRAAMQPESWYTAQEAVDAGLADAVLPAAKAPAAAPTASFDLSIFAHAGRDNAPEPAMPAARAPQTPAAQPVAPSTDPKEADTMSDTLLDGLRKQLGLSDDADEATVLAANAEALTEKADPPSASATVDLKAVAAALQADGKVVVSENVLEELKAQAQAGAQARAKQLAEERDEAITAAFREGKISAERRDAWKASWDKDPEGTKADLESLPARFPVAKVEGYQGHDESVGDSAKPFTDEEADALGALAGLPKGALR